MLGILSTAGQVSVYTPRGDPVRTQWDEVSPELYLPTWVVIAWCTSDESRSLT